MFSTASCSERGSLPSSLYHQGFQDLLERKPCAFMSGTSPVHGLYWFSTYPEECWSLSLPLPLFSTLSFLRGRSTPGQRPFAIQLPSIHHTFSPDPVAQVSSDSTLEHHRLSSFLGSQGTLQPKGPLGRYLGDAPPSFRVSCSLSLCPVKRLGDIFSLDRTVASHLLWGQANPSHGTLPWPA